MRVAIIYDHLEVIGGGEKVALTLAKHFGADLVTANVNPGILDMTDSEGVNVIDIGGLLHGSPFKQMHATWRFGRLRLKGYDFYIMCGNYAHHAAKAHHPNLYYCLTPMRAFYDQRDSVLSKQSLVHRVISGLWISGHSMIDRYAVRQCDVVVAISENVRGRIMRFYDRDASVIYPPVATGRMHDAGLGDYWLSVSRLYPEKRIDLQFEIFRRLPEEKLIIAGGYSKADRMDRYIAALAPPPNVTLLGEVTQEKLIELYAHCRGFITTAIDEDFGITPVEAMAAGKCVLATDEGGYRETVVVGRTGFLLPAEAGAFVSKIRELDDSALRSMKEACVARARTFDESVFLERMRTTIEER